MSWLSYLPDGALRILRQFILRQGRRMSADSLLAKSRRRAIGMALDAAKHSTAYQVLLREHGMRPEQLGLDTPLSSLPVLTKGNTFGRFSLDELSRPVPIRSIADVLTSSGRGGKSFGYRLTTREVHEESWFDIDLGLQDVFDVDRKSTLLVNCLPMGVVFRSKAVTVANVSVREDMACSILRDIGPKFDQTIVCTDPLFVRQLLREGERAGVDWTQLNTSLIVGEEMLVESQRDYIAERMGLDLDREPHRLIGSSYGVGELGLNLLFETRETIRIRRQLRFNAALQSHLRWQSGRADLPSVFCYNPLRTLIEVLQPDAHGYGELCITLLDGQAVIALPRFATGDLGRLLSNDEAQRASQLAGAGVPWLPMVLVQGRLKDRFTGMPSVELVKEVLYSNPSLADHVTGAFRLTSSGHGRVLLTVLVPEVTADLQVRLQACLADFRLDNVDLRLCSAEPSIWHPALDFERKFAYADPVTT